MLTFCLKKKKSYFGGFKIPSTKSSARTIKKSPKNTLPPSIDWRDRGAVTTVKNQLQCGISPEFGVISSIEATYVVYQGNQLTNLSVQQLSDCCVKYNNISLQCNGCDGSFFEPLFNYAIIYGIEQEEVYPYKGDDEICMYNAKKVLARVSSYGIVPAGDEDELTRVLAEQGVVANAVQADLQSFQLYTGGVYSDSRCRVNQIGHGITTIGYGVDGPSGLNYYILKNSWDVKWGEKGYMRILRDGSSTCGVAQYPYYPIVN